MVNEGGAGDSATDDTVEQLENLSIANDPAADSKVNIMKYNAIIHCTLYTLHCTLHTVPCTLYSTHCTLYTVLCTLYPVHCTLHCTNPFSSLAKLEKAQTIIAEKILFFLIFSFFLSVFSLYCLFPSYVRNINITKMY